MRIKYCRAVNCKSVGNKYILTFQDNLTKFNKVIPISNQEAAIVAKEFTKNFI